MSRVSGKCYFVYVLWSQAGHRFYIGISDDPERRLEQHNESARGWTRRYRPWILVHQERYEGYTDARKREIELKAQKGGQGFLQRTGLDPLRFRSGS
jgi:putative endonuclease